MSAPSEKMKAAIAAIGMVAGDTSVSLTTVRDDLEALRDEVDLRLQAVKDDIIAAEKETTNGS